jgi:hypothetical protein
MKAIYILVSQNLRSSFVNNTLNDAIQLTGSFFEVLQQLLS